MESKMTRKEELLKLCESLDDETRNVIYPLVDEVVFLEERLKVLREYDFIRINPNNPTMQKATAAAKQYKEFLQQYNNCVKIMLMALRRSEGEEASPLRAYLEGIEAR